MHKLRLFGSNFKLTYILALSTVPIICLNRRRYSRRINTLWPKDELKQSLPIRSARLETSSAEVFSDEWFESFVAIRTHFVKSLKNDFEGAPRTLCSGFIVTKTGLVVTTAASVAGYTMVNVKLCDDRQVFGQVVVDCSVEGLAVIQLISNPGTVDNWRAVTYDTENDSLMLGNEIYVIGNESYNRNNRVARGLICNRQHRAMESTVEFNWKIKYYSHSASISAREIGAPVVDPFGQVLGITCKKECESLCYFLPAKLVNEFVRKTQYSLLNPQSSSSIPKKSYGLVVQWMDEQNRDQFAVWAQNEGKTLPDKVTKGLIVLGYEKCLDNASKANLEKFDVITIINGINLNQKSDAYQALIYDHKLSTIRSFNAFVNKSNGSSSGYFIITKETISKTLL